MNESLEIVAYAVENHPTDSRCNLKYDGICESLSARMGTGGNNVPLVLCVLASCCKNAEITDGTISPTLLARAETGGNQIPIALIAEQGV